MLLTSQMTSDSLIHASSPLMLVYPSMADGCLCPALQVIQSAPLETLLDLDMDDCSALTSLLPLEPAADNPYHVTLLRKQARKMRGSLVAGELIYIDPYPNSPHGSASPPFLLIVSKSAKLHSYRDTR